MTWNFSATNDEAAAVTGAGVAVATYLSGFPTVHSILIGALAAFAVLGYTGYQASTPAAPAAGGA